MKLPLSEKVTASLLLLDEVGSTNDAMRELALAGELPEFSVVVSPNQTAGRGRLDRVWVAPPGATLAISVLLRPTLPGGEPLGVEHFGWYPLLAGVAMCRAAQAQLPGRTVGVKWPNDVQVDGAKASGILTELLPDARTLIIGVGINLDMTESQLPVPTATSLAIAGCTISGDELADAVLSRFLTELRSLCADFVRLGADVEASGTLDAVVEVCTTLGQEVRVQLPGGTALLGTATGIDSTGRLLVRRFADGRNVAVAAGDVTQLRYE